MVESGWAMSVAERQVLGDAILISRMHLGGASQLAAALGSLGLTEVSSACARAQHFSAGGYLEPLGHGLLGLNAFWTSHKSIHLVSKRGGTIDGTVNRIKLYFGYFFARHQTRVPGLRNA